MRFLVRFRQWLCGHEFTGGHFQQCVKCGKIRVLVTAGAGVGATGSGDGLTGGIAAFRQRRKRGMLSRFTNFTKVVGRSR